MDPAQRPKDLPFETQSPYTLVVYGLRMLFQLWPLWALALFTQPIDLWWADIVHNLSGASRGVATWFSPFIRVAFAFSLVPLTFVLKRTHLASWNTVDTAMAGLILTLFGTTLQYLLHLGMPTGSFFDAFRSPAFTQLFMLAGLCILLVLVGIRSPHGTSWLNDLVSPAPKTKDLAENGPVIKGTVKAPPPPQLRDIDPEKMAASLKKRVIGQDMIAIQLSRAVARRMAQQRRGKPVFTGLFAGPTGVGKTEMAKAVAVALFGSEKSLFRVDCGNVLGEAGLQTLIGAPTGYMGSDKPGALTAHVQRFPHSIILFDEIEKAMGQQGQQSPLFRLLLSLLDEGRFTEQSTGATVDATGCVILMTSNAAHKALGAIYEQYKEDPAALTRATKDELQSYFAPEFLARIDLVTSFSPLDARARSKVIAQHAGRIARQYDITLASVDGEFVSQALIQWQALEGYGAREILRWLEEVISDPIIEAKKKNITIVDLFWKNGAASVAAATMPEKKS